ncbi:hypothetical protein, partial [Metallibacterium scheffleri]|uniref:hypothetical protein n=1 Tax=Metallibacterium scheffleri TaxID=993689 RepID=UPI0023F3A70E
LPECAHNAPGCERLATFSLRRSKFSFTGQISGAKYNLQAGTGLSFDGLKYSVVASSGSGLKATGKFTLLSYVSVV